MKVMISVKMSLVLLLLSAPAFAIQPIKVLVAKTSGVPTTHAASMIDQIDDLMDKSGLSDRNFVYANYTGYVEEISCDGTTKDKLLECMHDELTDSRTQYGADIALMLVPQIAPTNGFTNCGAVDDRMINLETIHVNNRSLGRAVVSNQCLQTQGLYSASH